MRSISALLFDLDGTLIDSAVDMANAMNAVRAEHGEATVPISDLRPHTWRGARSMIPAAYGFGPEHERYSSLRARFLEIYARNSLIETRVWPGMDAVINELHNRRIPWGIVTNKASYLTLPIIAALKLTPQVLVCGDTTPTPKPHPAPLLYAADKLNLPAAQFAYIGDAISDIQAARAAGMLAIGAGYSDFPPDSQHAQWGAAHWLDTPADLLHLLTAGATTQTTAGN